MPYHLVPHTASEGGSEAHRIRREIHFLRTTLWSGIFALMVIWSSHLSATIRLDVTGDPFYDVGVLFPELGDPDASSPVMRQSSLGIVFSARTIVGSIHPTWVKYVVEEFGLEEALGWPSRNSEESALLSAIKRISQNGLAQQHTSVTTITRLHAELISTYAAIFSSRLRLAMSNYSDVFDTDQTRKSLVQANKRRKLAAEGKLRVDFLNYASFISEAVQLIEDIETRKLPIDGNVDLVSSSKFGVRSPIQDILGLHESARNALARAITHSRAIHFYKTVRGCVHTRF